MLDRLTFKQKLLAGPAIIAALAFVVSVMVVGTGSRTSGTLVRIESGYFPSLELSRDLEVALGGVQRSLQDAVAASDPDGLAVADALAEDFGVRVASQADNPALDEGELEELAARFTAYYALARATSDAMITGTGGPGMMDDLRAMTEQYAALTDELRLRTERDQASMAAAFDQVRGLQAASQWGILLVLLIGAAISGAVVWVVARGVIATLTELSTAAVEIAHGRIDQRIEYESSDELGVVARSFREIVAYVTDIATAAGNLAKGQLGHRIELRCEEDYLARNMNEAMDTLQGLVGETAMLIESARAGDLDRRGDPAGFDGAYGRLMSGTNEMLDAMAEPIGETMSVLDRLAGGDLTARMTGTYAGRFDALKANLNLTVSTLATTLRDIRNASGEVTNNSSHLQTMSQDMTGTADATTRETNEVSVASSQASQNVQMVASAAEELSSSIREISGQLQEALAVAKRASSEAEATVKVMDELGHSSQEIDEVVSLINNIAEQTNLLALNATIEAARAGDAGKGFAVVAGEVKQLASQTGRATDEISGKIRLLQSRTRDGVDGIRAISEVLERMNQISMMVASAVEEQSAAVGEIARSAAEASQGTDQVARSIEGVSQAAVSTARGADELRGSATTLAAVAGSLDTLVGAFRLDDAAA